MADMKVVIDPVLFKAFMDEPGGPVMRHMMVVGERVKKAWLDSMPEKGKDGWPRSFFAKKIVKRIKMTEHGPSVEVGTNTTKTEPHPIDGNPLLVFDWPKAGGVVYLRHVNHPGSDFTEYLNKTGKAALEKTKGNG
jgi:hypothetical protein